MQIDHEVFRGRLKDAAKALGKAVGAWLDELGVKNTVYSALNRGAVPGIDTLAAIAASAGRSIDWLIGLDDDQGHHVGETRAPYEVDGDEFVYVKRYNVKASGGNGEFICEENVIGRYAYQKDWWYRNMPCEPSACAIIECDGRSMEPDIYDGEPIMLNTADRGLNTDAAYVFRLGDRLLVKRLQFLPGDRINVISSNKADYPAYEIDMETLQNHDTGAVIGRAFGVPGGFRWIR